MPAASASEKPAVLMLTTLPVASKAKFLGARITFPASAVKSEPSSSAMKPSLNELPTYSGNSSERNRKSSERQFAPAGTVRSIRSVTRSSKLPPCVPPPPPLPWLVPLLSLGSSANRVLPELRIV